MSFTDEERAELIAALSRTADMVAGLLDALDILRVVLGSRPPANRGRFAAAPRALSAVAPATRKATITGQRVDDRTAHEGAVIHRESLRCGSYWVALLGFLAFVVLAFAASTEARRGDLATSRALVGASIVALYAGTEAFTVTMSLEIRLLSRH